MPDPAYEAKYGKGPHLTADAVVVRGNEVALVQRKNGGQWALPGGFLDQGETLSECAIREFKEEAGVDLCATPGLILGIDQPLAFDAIDRDPRSRIISGAVLITLSEEIEMPELVAGDDAVAVRWARWDALPPLYADHNAIVEAMRKRFDAALPCDAGIDLDRLKVDLLKGQFSSMTISCNDHLGSYITAAQAIEQQPDYFDDESFASPEERQRCIETNTIWTLHYYPNTPVGFSAIHASSFSAILAALTSET